ncbi:MAG: hypothetical protein QNJ46_01800 [Leptolyngbyaceae cyanobacterium MO_188.B28]|nr:hypothetical protein [Leptolyngbyaceae cyanobacterium MO_188.B28]
MTLFAAPKAQAQILELDLLPGQKPASNPSKPQGNLSGINLDFKSPITPPTLYTDTPFKSMDRSAFSPEADNLLWTVPLKSLDPENSVDSVQSSDQSVCLPIASSPDTPQTGILPDDRSHFSVSASTVCTFDDDEMAVLANSMAGLMNLSNSEIKKTVLNLNGGSEKVPEPTISAAIWLGITAMGVLSTQFKPKK